MAKELKRTAYHEAGHAFVAWREGLRVKRATIRPTADYFGQVHHASGLSAKQVEELDVSIVSPRVREALEKRIRISFAGWLAEHRHDRTADEAHSMSDYGHALDLMMRLAGSQREINLYSALLKYQTKEMLRVGWPHVRAIAVALLERKTLTGQEIRQVINKSYGRREMEVHIDEAGVAHLYAKPD
jgi:ATP-dependent Zn protease